jgi:hypothetical protein
MEWVPTIDHTKFTYVRLQAVTWVANGLVFSRQVQSRSGTALASLIERHAKSKPVLINCRGINKVDEYALEPVSEAIRVARHPVVMTEITSTLLDDLTRLLRPEPVEILTSARIAIWAAEPMNHDVLQGMLKVVPTEEQSRLEQHVRKAFVQFPKPQRLSSTPLIATGAFDARLITSNAADFIQIVLAMADRFHDILEREGLTNPRILSVSVRASPFAAAISALAYPRVELELVDHLGPRHFIVEEELIPKSRSSVDYIYIADFVLGGTEVKIAQSYAQQRGASLRHAIAIGSLLPPSDYRFSDLTLARLADLACCPDAKYSV